MKKSTLICTGVIALLWYLMGWVWYGMLGLSNEHTLSNLMKSETEMSHPLLLGGLVIMAWAFATIYGKWARGVHTSSQGFQYGALLGIMAGIGIGLVNFSTTHMMDMTGTLIESVYRIVEYGVAGVVAAMIYAKFDNP